MGGMRRRKRMKSLAGTIKDNRSVAGELGEEKYAQSDLPTELLGLILFRLSLRDNIRASAVCKTWRDIAISVRKANRPPWLMYVPKSGNLYKLYDPSKRKTYYLDFPELRGPRICYARDGWLLLFKTRTQRVFFFCPYTLELIKMPKLQLGQQTLAFSATPMSPNCVLFTVKSVTQAVVAVSMCRPGEPQWTTVHLENYPAFVSTICNKVVFCEGLFYCLSPTGWLGVYNPEETAWDILPLPPPQCTDFFSVENWWKGKYIFEHKGDIIVVYTCAALVPSIYKLGKTNQEWVEIEGLGGTTLFANFQSSHVMTDLLGKMRDVIYFSKVMFYGKRCVTYSPNDGRYYPRMRGFDWAEQDPFRSVWIDPPKDISTFLQRRRVTIIY